MSTPPLSILGLLQVDLYLNIYFRTIAISLTQGNIRADIQKFYYLFLIFAGFLSRGLTYWKDNREWKGMELTKNLIQ
jgi:hypothetical protein